MKFYRLFLLVANLPRGRTLFFAVIISPGINIFVYLFGRAGYAVGVRLQVRSR